MMHTFRLTHTGAAKLHYFHVCPPFRDFYGLTDQQAACLSVGRAAKIRTQWIIIMIPVINRNVPPIVPGPLPPHPAVEYPAPFFPLQTPFPDLRVPILFPGPELFWHSGIPVSSGPCFF